MQYAIKVTDPVQSSADCLVVGIFSDQTLSVVAEQLNKANIGQINFPEQMLSAAAEQLDKASAGHIKKLLGHGDLRGECGQTLWLYDVPGIAARRVLLVGCGKPEEFDEQAYQKVLAKAVAALKHSKAQNAVSYLTDLPVLKRDVYWKIRLAVQTSSDVLYRFDRFKTTIKDDKKFVLADLVFNIADSKDQVLAQKALIDANAIVAGMQLTKDLGNLPANICTPTYMAEQALLLAKEFPAIKVTVLKKAEIEKLKMGAFLSVARGSHQAPKLVVLEYSGANKDQRPVALVGKGVTFDSGGISLKPALGMEEMKFDMCGAASVLGTFRALAELKLPLNLVGVLPITENLPGGNASKPGDVVTTMSGQTVEIMNTDAEGRLILSDALSYCEKFNPETVIDIATLTGAIIIALGALPSGLFGNHDPLINALKTAADKSCDRVWQMPLWEGYQEQIDSNVADMANVGLAGGKSITAACFLSRFTKKYQWAHLDIAGTAWQTGKDKAATGRPVPLLVQYLLDKVA